MLLRELFQSDVTRPIAPVVYFHEQSPERLEAEVGEYIITGGWPEGHPNRRRVPSGIHEEYVRLLDAIAAELAKPGGPELPTAWISGFYGSGKSSFAKLLGLALDGAALPDGRSITEAWLARDTSPRAAELRTAWDRLRRKIEPVAVVFDVGSVARSDEHVHAAAVRQVQRRLGYCTTEPLVADFELKLERDGAWPAFESKALQVLGRPWSEVKDRALAEEDFSLVLSELYPQRYTDPMSWYESRAGTGARAESPEEAVDALRDMLRFRARDATLFLVVDEVSQYVLASKDRVDRLRAFASALGARLRGRAWLLALGQQKLDEDADESFLVWAKDRFPPALRVHLAATNIRDVVHKRLLQKTPAAEAALRALFERHRPELKLYAYGCESVSPEEFVEVYPLLPGQIDLILELTTALRTRSRRAQGDDQAIRGLLQLLGELFRSQRLAEAPLGTLVSLDLVYDVQHTALDAETQASMARVLAQCSDDASGTLVRVAKVVALLELVQEQRPTDPRLVAQCLYDRADLGNRLDAVTEALEELTRRGLLTRSEKTGYRLQSSAGEEWERERKDLGGSIDARLPLLQQGLKVLLGEVDRPRLAGRPFPWAARFSDGRRVQDAVLQDPRDDAAVLVDLRLLPQEERGEAAWVRRSDESALQHRLVWVAGASDAVDELGRELHRSQAMLARYQGRKESLGPAKRLLYQQEEGRAETLERRLRDALGEAWMAGRLYFRGRVLEPSQLGASFGVALHAAGTQLLPNLFTYFIPTQLQPSELMQLLEPELSGPSPKLLAGELGILDLDAGRYVPAVSGVVPTRVLEQVNTTGGLEGQSLLAWFAGPPYGYTANVVKAAVAGLLRAGKLRITPEGGGEITAVRDAGVRELFTADRAFRRASLYPAGDDDIGVQARARLCRMFETRLGLSLEREDHALADAVARSFPEQARRLREVESRLARLPPPPAGAGTPGAGADRQPEAFVRLAGALEACLRSVRETRPTLRLLKRHHDALGDGLALLQVYAVELDDAAVTEVREADAVLRHRAAQLQALGVATDNLAGPIQRITAQLARDTPWRERAALVPDLDEIRRAYAAERRRLLAWQEAEAEQVRSRVKLREGFTTLTADQAHQVLGPLYSVPTDTTEDAVAPSLVELRDGFRLALERAEEAAHETLDAVLSAGRAPRLRRLELGLRNREIGSEAELEALLAELRARVLERLQAGERIRLL